MAISHPSQSGASAQLSLELPFTPPAPVIILTAKGDSQQISTHYLLSIAHRMLADNAPELKSVAIVREGFGHRGNNLRVVLSREPNNKTTETWGWAD